MQGKIMHWFAFTPGVSVALNKLNTSNLHFSAQTATSLPRGQEIIISPQTALLRSSLLHIPSECERWAVPAVARHHGYGPLVLNMQKSYNMHICTSRIKSVTTYNQHHADIYASMTSMYHHKLKKLHGEQERSTLTIYPFHLLTRDV